jgi:hypothetical protein
MGRRSSWVTVEAPERYDGEYWTFLRPQDGALVCFSSIIGSPSLLGDTVSPSPMVVRMPPGRISEIAIVTAP